MQDSNGKRALNIALPKGRLGESVYGLFEQSGYASSQMGDGTRRLIFESDNGEVRYFWVKPSDVWAYVERGVADIGIAGKDILLEYEPDVYELLDLGVGRCRMAVAALKGFRANPLRTLRVATKFANIARKYYAEQGRDIDIIPLHGSIELAPIVGLSDVIVDIVETGTTLRENNLEVIAEIVPLSARLIANKANYAFESARIDGIVDQIAGLLLVREQG